MDTLWKHGKQTKYDAGQSLLEFMRSHLQQSRFWSDGVERDIGPFAAMIIQKPDGEPSDAPESR